MKLLGILLLLLLIPGVACAESFTEDFESFILEGFNPELKPEQTWYSYTDRNDDGNVTDQPPIIEGTQSFRFVAPADGSTLDDFVSFRLARPTTLTSFNFTIQGEPVANTTGGSIQVVTISSASPSRGIVEFYIFCNNSTFTEACEFKVRFDQLETTGDTLINATLNETRFEIEMVFDWLDGEYRLFVNGVDDGIFPFLELPRNVATITIKQYRGDVQVFTTFDVWTISGALPGTGVAEGDAATGLKNFATSIRFTSTGSLFLLGIIVFLAAMAAVYVPVVEIGRDNSTVPALSLFAVLVTYWLIDLGWWPEWMGIAGIIAASVLIASLVREKLMGVRNAASGGALVGASLGYFIIATSLLAFSGYATETIAVPISPAEQQGLNMTEETQTFIGAVAECVFTGGVFTFGLVGDCSQDTTTTTWQRITDAAGEIYGWVRAGLDFVFQLLTFQLPIPVIFSLMIVFPPAVALATYGIATIRGVSS